VLNRLDFFFGGEGVGGARSVARVFARS